LPSQSDAAAAWPLPETSGDAEPPSVPPIVETLVARPRASLALVDGTVVASVENGPGLAGDLSMPQGQVLNVMVLGHATWANETSGRIGFYLVVQQRIDGEWATVGMDGVGGFRAEPSLAKGRVVVAIRFDEPGRQSLRAIVRSLAEPDPKEGTAGSAMAQRLDVLEIQVDVFPASIGASTIADGPIRRQSEGWLASDPPDLSEMLAVLSD
jgi:hypothetical protein